MKISLYKSMQIKILWLDPFWPQKNPCIFKEVYKAKIDLYISIENPRTPFVGPNLATGRKFKQSL